MAKDKDQALFEIHENRLARMDTRIGHIEAQSNDMHAIITNGLVEQVRTAKRLSIWVLGLLVLFLASQVAIVNMVAQNLKP